MHALTKMNQIKRSIIATAVLAFSISLVAPLSAHAVTYPTAQWIVPNNPRAVVIVVHGGSWNGQDPNLVNAMVPMAQQLSAKSRSVTMNIDYRPGKYSLDHVILSYDRARQKFPNLPICVAGASAGGNLALLLATKRPVNCVIAEVAPTDINTASESVRNAGVFFFGESELRAWSPLYVTKRIKVPTMLVNSKNDPLIPYVSQGVAFKKKFPKSILITLTPGDQKASLYHSQVDSTQMANARNREATMIINVANRYKAAKSKTQQSVQQSQTRTTTVR